MSTITVIDLIFKLSAIVFVIGSLWLLSRRRIPKGLELPPGPPGKFIVGNSADLPTHHEWETYTRWAKEYGNLVHISVMGQSIVIVNSMDVARDLFERRSSLYSDRFDSPMLTELMGYDYPIPFMKYGQKWRRQRRIFHEYFHAAAAPAYRDVPIKHARDMIQNIQKSPDEFITHIRHFVGAMILEAVYGIEVLPTNDPYIELLERAMSSITEAGNPGTFLVDILPIMKHIPEWFPGAGFKRKARVWKNIARDSADVPFFTVKHALESGTARPSFTSSHLEKIPSDEDAPSDQEQIIRNSAASAYGAGSDTTIAALSSFMLAMVLHPDAQRKAQEELDRVVGMGRLPTFDDREDLPYVNALCNEVMRWHPVLPLSIAHRVTQDDVYGRYFIPRGSLIIGNAWAMLHDEQTYGPRPEEFIPERFLNKDVPDPTAAFGFGRRICPGRHFAESTLFIAVAYILQTFRISHARDSNGSEIHVRDSVMSDIPSRFNVRLYLGQQRQEACFDSARVIKRLPVEEEGAT